MSKNVFYCKKFKNRILDLMDDQKITPKQIVADTENKISDAWFSKLKRGAVKSPSADIVFILSQYFNVSTDYLLGIEDGTKHQATADLDALGLDEECLNIILRAKGTDEAKKIAFLLKNKDKIFDFIEGWEK